MKKYLIGLISIIGLGIGGIALADKCPTPTFSPVAGSYEGSVEITILPPANELPPMATPYYTTNGDDPDNGDTNYTHTFTITESGTVKAIVWTAMGCTPSSDIGSAVYTITEAEEESGGVGISTLMASSSEQFQDTTGFTVGGTVSWVADNFIKLFLGSGLALLLALRYWIVALIIIGAIVYFSYRAFAFFKH